MTASVFRTVYAEPWQRAHLTLEPWRQLHVNHRGWFRERLSRPVSWRLRRAARVSLGEKNPWMR